MDSLLMVTTLGLSLPAGGAAGAGAAGSCGGSFGFFFGASAAAAALSGLAAGFVRVRLRRFGSCSVPAGLVAAFLVTVGGSAAGAASAGFFHSGTWADALLARSFCHSGCRL
jgi:hypothetical protein